jgi:hypothetical protein
MPVAGSGEAAEQGAQRSVCFDRVGLLDEEAGGGSEGFAGVRFFGAGRFEPKVSREFEMADCG